MVHTKTTPTYQSQLVPSLRASAHYANGTAFPQDPSSNELAISCPSLQSTVTNGNLHETSTAAKQTYNPKTR